MKSLRHWVLPATLICVLFLIVGFTVVQKYRDHQQARLAVSEDVSLKALAVLTTANNAYPRPEPKWKKALLDRLPGKLVRYLPEKWVKSADYYAAPSMGDNHLMPFIQIQYPKEWSEQQNSLYRRLSSTLSRSGIDVCYLKFPNGYISNRKVVYPARANDHAPKSDIRQIVGDLIFLAPPNHETFEMHFATMSPNGDIKPSAGRPFTFNNPLFKHNSPITSAPALPITVTHDGVSVTLRALGTKCHSKAGMAIDGTIIENSDPAGSFVKAAGTFDDPYHAIAVFDVSENGTTTSEWAVCADSEVHYGDPISLKFPTHQHVKAGRYQSIVYGRDFGVLEQPVKLSISLQRQCNFSDEELRIAEIPLPESGNYTTTPTIVNLWDTTATLFLGNRQLIGDSYNESPKVYDTKPIDFVCVHGRFSKMKHPIHAVHLRLTNGKNLDLLKFKANEVLSNTSQTTLVDLDKAIASLALTDDDARGSTIVVSLLSPKEFSHTFEFIAKPAEATLEPVRGSRAAGADIR